MAYTADGVLSAENYGLLKRRMELMQVRLDHAHERYDRLRQLVEFYQTVGAEDAKALVDRYRTALKLIVAMEPDLDIPANRRNMVRIAEEALRRG